MRSLGRHWNHFWFEPASPDNLGLCRIFLYGTMFLFYVFSPLLFKSWGWHENFTLWGKVSPAFWTPVWLFSVLHLPQLSTGPLIAIQSLWWVALALSCVGLFTRVSTATSFIFGGYLFGLPNNFGKIHHLDQLLFWVFLVMAFSRCGDAWSIDALIRKARANSSAALDPAPSAEYTWPVHLIWVISAVVYAEAGLSKLRHSGFAWITTATMQNYLLQAYYHVSDSEPLTSWGLFFGGHHWLASALAGVSLVFEIGILFALFSPKSRWILVPGVVGMQTGIALFMGPNFYQMIMCQALWIPWDRVVDKLASRFGGPKKYALAFDGACGMCERTVGVLKSVDVLHRVEFLNTARQWPDVAKQFPGLDRTQAHIEMHVRSPRGQVTAGFYAYRSLAWALPLGWMAVPFLYLPGVGRIGSHIYRSVAARRNRNLCELPALHPEKG
jgi:predicted DCC family thiol-disulfide oxidoreductase YuxK